MSRNGTLLPLPAGYTLPAWPLEHIVEMSAYTFPRSVWLARVEHDLRAFYPQASTADLALTARTHAPFPLAQPGVR